MTFAGLKKDKAFKRLRRPKLQIAQPPKPKAPDETPDEYDRLKRLLGDEQLAKRIMKLQAKFPQGTTPELVTYDWLERHGHKFFYQIELFGGRRKRGGVVPDFLIITNRAEGLAWGIDGVYWHTLVQAQEKDLTYGLRIIGQYFQGVRITNYVRLNELDVYNRRPQVFYLALSGIEINKVGVA